MKGTSYPKGFSSLFFLVSRCLKSVVLISVIVISPVPHVGQINAEDKLQTFLGLLNESSPACPEIIFCSYSGSCANIKSKRTEINAVTVSMHGIMNACMAWVNVFVCVTARQPFKSADLM